MIKQANKSYGGYELKYLFTPGKWMSDIAQKELKALLDRVNHDSGRNLDYGVFDPNLSWDATVEFFTQSNLCLIYLNGEISGFFYNFILQETSPAAVHAGLVVITRNTGIDLLGIPYMYMAILQYRQLGSYFYTNISSTPSIVGTFTDLFGKVWPSHKESLLKPPIKKYRQIVEILSQEYIRKFFPKDEIHVDLKRFVLRSPTQKMGFEANFRKLPKYKDFLPNLFCQFWLDYSRGEDLIQVGKVDFWICLRGYVRVGTIALREFFQASPKLLQEKTERKTPSFIQINSPAEPLAQYKSKQLLTDKLQPKGQEDQAGIVQ